MWLGLFGAFDENLDGHIDFKEMACGISACCRGPMVEKHKCRCLLVCHTWILFWHYCHGWLGSRVVSVLERSRAWVQITAATLSGNSLRQTVRTHHTSVHQAAKLVAARG